MKIRVANIKDARGVAKVHIDTWKVCYKGIVPDLYLDSFDYAERTKLWEKGLCDESQFNFIAEQDQEIIGWVTFGLNRDKRSEDIFEIYGIYVLPEHWGSNVGESLFTSAMKKIEIKSPRTVTLWVLEENIRARIFYQKYGFKLDGVTEKIKIGGKDLTEIRYEKTYAQQV